MNGTVYKKKTINALWIFLITFTAGAVLFCDKEPLLPEKEILINLFIDTSTAWNRPVDTFFVKDTATFIIDVAFAESIDSLAFRAIPLNPGQDVSLETINAIPESSYIHSNIDIRNRFSYCFEEPGEFLFVGSAWSKVTDKSHEDFDTLRITVIEKQGFNQSPEIETLIAVGRRYASPFDLVLPCSLIIKINNIESWQKETLTVLNSNGPTELIGDSLFVWMPSPNDTPGYRQLGIVITDNGLPPKSDTAYINYAILDSTGKLPPPKNLHLVKMSKDTIKLEWDADSIADQYRIYRSNSPNTGSGTEFAKPNYAWYILNTDSAYFWVKSESSIRNRIYYSEASQVVYSRDTLHYAHRFSFSDSVQIITRDSLSFTCILQVSKAVKAPVSVRLTVSDSSVIDSALVNFKPGDTTMTVTFKNKENDLTAGASKKLVVKIASVSSGYVAGIIRQSILIINNDSTSCSLFYSANGGTGNVPVDTTKYKLGTQVKVPGSGNLAKTGHIFRGWNDMANGKGASYIPYSYITLQNKSDTLYAEWEKLSYTVTFNSQGGGAVAQKNIYYNDTILKPANPSPPSGTRCTFGGWYMETGCSTLWNFSARVTSAVTLYAKWLLDVMPGTNCVIANKAGPNEAISAYNLVANRRVGYTKDSTAFKDLQDLSVAGEGFSGKLGSQNGTTFASSNLTEYNSVTNVSLKNLVSSKKLLTTITIGKGTVFVAKLGNNRGFAIVQISDYNPNGGNWTGNKGEAKFTYKFTPP